jgi:hypothetical protein
LGGWATILSLLTLLLNTHTTDYYGTRSKRWEVSRTESYRNLPEQTSQVLYATKHLSTCRNPLVAQDTATPTSVCRQTPHEMPLPKRRKTSSAKTGGKGSLENSIQEEALVFVGLGGTISDASRLTTSHRLIMTLLLVGHTHALPPDLREPGADGATDRRAPPLITSHQRNLLGLPPSNDLTTHNSKHKPLPNESIPVHAGPQHKGNRTP